MLETEPQLFSRAASALNFWVTLQSAHYVSYAVGSVVMSPLVSGFDILLFLVSPRGQHIWPRSMNLILHCWFFSCYFSKLPSLSPVRCHRLVSSGCMFSSAGSSCGSWEHWLDLHWLMLAGIDARTPMVFVLFRLFGCLFCLFSAVVV